MSLGDSDYLMSIGLRPQPPTQGGAVETAKQPALRLMTERLACLLSDFEAQVIRLEDLQERIWGPSPKIETKGEAKVPTPITYLSELDAYVNKLTALVSNLSRTISRLKDFA